MPATVKRLLIVELEVSDDGVTITTQHHPPFSEMPDEPPQRDMLAAVIAKRFCDKFEDVMTEVVAEMGVSGD